MSGQEITGHANVYSGKREENYLPESEHNYNTLLDNKNQY